MTEHAARRPIARAPTHPGELMREILEQQFKLPIAEAARRMGVSRQGLHAVLSGHAAATAEMAVKFADLVDGRPDLFVYMQANRDLWFAQRKLHGEPARH